MTCCRMLYQRLRVCGRRGDTYSDTSEKNSGYSVLLSILSGGVDRADDELTSSPITARNCRSLYAEGGRAILYN